MNENRTLRTLVLPLSVPTSKKKKFSINLNAYRNAHFYTLSSAKRFFTDLVQNQIESLPRYTEVELTYRVYPSSKRSMDIMNVCTVADKFFCDALVEAGKLEDDNYNHVTKVTGLFGQIDNKNPRIEVDIYGVEEDMKILIDNKELMAIILAHLSDQIIIAEGNNPVIQFTTDGVVIDILKDKPSTKMDEIPETSKENIKEVIKQKTDTPSLLKETPLSAPTVTEGKDGNLESKPATGNVAASLFKKPVQEAPVETTPETATGAATESAPEVSEQPEAKPEPVQETPAEQPAKKTISLFGKKEPEKESPTQEAAPEIAQESGNVEDATSAEATPEPAAATTTHISQTKVTEPTQIGGAKPEDTPVKKSGIFAFHKN